MPMTGADLASLADIRRIAATTGDLAVTTATSTSKATDAAKTEVDDVVKTMSTQFNDTLDSLDGVADTADRQILTSGWQGQARENAVKASSDFRTGVAKLGTDSRTALTDFGAALDKEVTSLTEDITGRFTTLMTAAQQSFEQFATAVSSYGTDLETADASVTYR